MATIASAPKKHSKSDKQEIAQGLNPLYTPDNFAKNRQSLDIIAVPGLGSDMTWTWVDRTTKVHWLRDEQMLRKMVPNARISVFGYRSQWYGKDAVQTHLSSIANDLLHALHQDSEPNNKRPIIFVGHSLGGLVIAKAVSEAKRRPEDYPGIFTRITSCVFLGTPFRGSEVQALAHIVAMTGSTIGMAKDSEILRSLKAGSGELADLVDAFLGDVRKASVDLVCYWESENTMVIPDWNIKNRLFDIGAPIATEKSSTFDGYPKFSWARTHVEMNKFEGPKDPNYRDVSSYLKTLSERSFKLVKSRDSSVLQEMANDSRVEKILEALEVIDLRKDFEAIKRKNSIGISSSFIEHDLYKKWKDEPISQSLWIEGSPGKGKTLSAISMKAELSKLTKNDPEQESSAVLAFFFCDEQEIDKSRAINVLKSLSWQLLKAKRHLARHFFSDDSKSKAAAQKGTGQKAEEAIEFSSLAELWKCLQSALLDPSLGTVYFLINGLDQIDSVSRKEFLAFVKSFRAPKVEDDAGPFVKWLFLSVPRDDIRDALRDALKINLDDGSNTTRQDEDLRLHVGQKIGDLAKRKKYSKSLEYFVKSYVSFKAKGKSNYDWVNLVCLELENDTLQYSVIRQHLESLPSDLWPMYDQVSRRVLSSSGLEVEYTKEILRSLLLVNWPPSLHELAIIADLPEPCRNDESAIREHIGRCGAFATHFDGDDGKCRVQLSHSSVREYLKSKADDWLSISSEQIQHGIIALRCFEYIRAAVQKADMQQTMDSQGNAEDGQTDPVADESVVLEPSKEEPANEEQNGAEVATLVPLQYPYTQWIQHALKATPDIVDSFGLEDVFWVLESEERAEWSKNYSTFTGESGFDVKFTALHIAAYFGYVPLAELLLKNNHQAELEMVDSKGFQPLYWACRRNHMNMVQILVEAGSDVNFFQGDEITPLHGAVLAGNQEITEYLLNHKATVDVPNENWGTALYMAIEADNLSIVRQLIDRGASVNSKGGAEDNPLNCAAYAGNLEIVQILVEKGAEIDPDIEYYCGNALGVASWRGHKEVVRFLLQKGSQVNRPMADDDFPLASAAAEGFGEVVQLLLDYDFNPLSHDKALLATADEGKLDCAKILVERCPNVERSEPFHTAASNGYTEILKVLTSTGISSELMDKSLYEAADYQHVDTVRLLLEMGANANAEGEEYGNALQAAAYDGTQEIIQLLLDNHADVNLKYGETTYGTALQAAAFQGSIENVKLLVENGAHINMEACGIYGNPLQAACFSGRTDVVQYLLENGANPNAIGGQWSYPIIAVTESGGHPEILDLLIKHNADVNVKNSNDGCTPLINAAMNLPKASVELLINSGATIHDFDNDHDNALTSAAESGDAETVLFLLEKGSDIHNIGKWGGALYRATDVGGIDCMKVLLQHGIDVNQEGGDKHTPLQVAAYHGNVESVKLLLEHKADINKAGGIYETALQAAAAACSFEVVKILLDNGADINVKGGRYGTALHAAMQQDVTIELVDLLLSHGADINAVTDTGTVLQLATIRSSTEVVTHLLEKGSDVNLRGGKYETALQSACNVETTEEVKLLLEHGADIAIEGGFYGSALNAAAAMFDEEILPLLLEKQPSPHMLVEALHAAVHYREEDAVSMLLKHGADVTAASRKYETAFVALDTPLSKEEQDQVEGIADDDDDDDDDEVEDDGNDENESKDGDNKSDGSSDSNDSDDTDSETDTEADKAEEIEIYEGIKKMLTDAVKDAKVLSGDNNEQNSSSLLQQTGAVSFDHQNATQPEIFENKQKTAIRPQESVLSMGPLPTQQIATPQAQLESSKPAPAALDEKQTKNLNPLLPPMLSSIPRRPVGSTLNSSNVPQSSTSAATPSQPITYQQANRWHPPFPPRPHPATSAKSDSDPHVQRGNDNDDDDGQASNLKQHTTRHGFNSSPNEDVSNQFYESQEPEAEQYSTPFQNTDDDAENNTENPQIRTREDEQDNENEEEDENEKGQESDDDDEGDDDDDDGGDHGDDASDQPENVVEQPFRSPSPDLGQVMDNVATEIKKKWKRFLS